MSDALPSDPAELREMIAALEVENARMTKENARLAATLRAHDLLIEALRARIAKLQRQRFGPSSEKIEREIEQLVLALEDLQVAAAEGDTIEPEDPDADASVSADTEVEAEEPAEAPKPRRRPRVAEGTPRERRVLGPGEACPDCGGDLRIVGQDVSELVDLIAAKAQGDRDRPPQGVLPALRAHGPSSRAEPADPPQHGRAPACSPTCSCPSSTTTCPSIARPRSSPAWGPTSPTPRSSTGAGGR